MAAHIEGTALLNGVPKAGVRAQLFARSDAGDRTGSLLDTDITNQGKKGIATQTIFNVGRFYFGGLTTGNYVVYLQGGGFDGINNPAHRLPFDIVDPEQVPAETLMFVGNQLYLFGNQSSATTLSYVVNLVSKPTALATINAAEGAKLAALVTGTPRVSIYTDSVIDTGSGSGAGAFYSHSKAGAGYLITHKLLYTHDSKFTDLKWITEADISVSGQEGHIKLEVFLTDGVSLQGSTVLNVTSDVSATVTLTHDISALIAGTTYIIEISIEGTAPSTLTMSQGHCDAV